MPRLAEIGVNPTFFKAKLSLAKKRQTKSKTRALAVLVLCVRQKTKSVINERTIEKKSGHRPV